MAMLPIVNSRLEGEDRDPPRSWFVWGGSAGDEGTEMVKFRVTYISCKSVQIWPKLADFEATSDPLIVAETSTDLAR